MGFLDFLNKKNTNKLENTMSVIDQDVNIDNSQVDEFSDIPLPKENTQPEYNSTILEPEEMVDSTKPPVIQETPSPDNLFGEESKEKDEPVEVKDDNLNFSLPEFSDEDFKVGSLAQEPQNVISKEKIVEKIQIQPLQNSSLQKVSEDKNSYLELNNCTKIFDSIGFIQNAIEKSKDGFQKQEIVNKNKIQQYKSLHDDLNVIQEQFMEIDRTLFEG